MYYCFHKIIKQHSYFNIDDNNEKCLLKIQLFQNRNKLYFKIY